MLAVLVPAVVFVMVAVWFIVLVVCVVVPGLVLSCRGVGRPDLSDCATRRGARYEPKEHQHDWDTLSRASVGTS